MGKAILLTDDELEFVSGGVEADSEGGDSGKWAYRIYATKAGYLDIRKIFTGYNSSQEARDAKDWMVRKLTSEGYTVHLTAVYKRN